MNTDQAVALLAAPIPRAVATWAELGAGEGTFTRALAQRLEPGSRIYAVDRDARALAALERGPFAPGVQVTTVAADFTRPFELPGVAPQGLDGLLLANSLHFIRDAATALARLTRLLRPDGRLVVVEYDGRWASRWVPYPIPPARLGEIVAAAGFGAPEITATRPSLYGGLMYVAAAERLARAAGRS